MKIDKTVEKTSYKNHPGIRINDILNMKIIP